jgi:hypothetical protein
MPDATTHRRLLAGIAAASTTVTDIQAGLNEITTLCNYDHAADAVERCSSFLDDCMKLRAIAAKLGNLSRELRSEIQNEVTAAQDNPPTPPDVAGPSTPVRKPQAFAKGPAGSQPDVAGPPTTVRKPPASTSGPAGPRSPMWLGPHQTLRNHRHPTRAQPAHAARCMGPRRPSETTDVRQGPSRPHSRPP